jgi:hypothetical protein
MHITQKDWNRMLDLSLAGENGASVASKIRDRYKAAARFICGLKLEGRNIELSSYGRNTYSGPYSDFGNQAIRLGISPDLITAVFNRTTVPSDIANKQKELSASKLNNRFVGKLSKALIKAGCKVSFAPHSGNAITNEGRYAMEQNGRKWTIGYKMIIECYGQTINLTFDAITCEGGGPTSYVVSTQNSDNIFNSCSSYERVGIYALINSVMSKMNIV